MSTHPERRELAVSRESRESKESKENEIDPELAAAATLERADYLVKEVKSSKQQMQNILIHMTQVQQAIAQIRAQLQLVGDIDATSAQHDQAQVKKLQEKISLYKDELRQMRETLITEQTKLLQKQHPESDTAGLHEQAIQMVDELIGME